MLHRAGVNRRVTESASGDFPDGPGGMNSKKTWQDVA